MQDIVLYDPNRVPPDWMALICPGQYAAFLTDVESSAPVRPDGSLVKSATDHFCLLFDSLSEAENYCCQAVKKVPRLKCELFDSEGRLNAPVAVFVNPEYAHKIDTEARARRLVRWGVALSATALAFFAYAWWAGFSNVWWPVLVGINLFFAGLRMMHWGQGLKEELKFQRKQAERRRQNVEKTKISEPMIEPD